MKPWFFVLISFSLSSYGNIFKDIEHKIKSQGLSKNKLGIVISQIDSNQNKNKEYKLNAEKLFTPASLAKIASLSALYEIYPDSYNFKTLFLSSAPIKKGILYGNLILKGGGDSSFTSESLWNLVNIFIRSGIHTIEGNLLIDDSLYKKETPLPYSERSYSAPIGAASFNWNSIGFFIRPNLLANQKALVFTDPKNSYVQIINKVKTGKKNKILIKRKYKSRDKEVFEIQGEIDKNTNEIIKYRNITRPALWLGSNAIAFLKQRGIVVTGKVKKGKCQGECKALAKWESRDFHFHAQNLMKYSSNYTARMLVSHIPIFKGAKQGDLREGMKFIRERLIRQGIQNFQLIEPSGLNRKNKFRPQDLQKILIHSQKQFYGPEMLSSYPLAGAKGTLKKRKKLISPSFHIRAKTGTLYGVLGLAGFAKSKFKKENYVFVFLFNGKNSQIQKAEHLFDDILLSLLQ